MSPQDWSTIATAWARACEDCKPMTHAEGLEHYRRCYFETLRSGSCAGLSPVQSGFYLDALRAAFGA